MISSVEHDSAFLFVREVAGISSRTTESFVGTDPSDKHLAFARLWS